MDHQHGTIKGYRKYGCRCEPCTEAYERFLVRVEEKYPHGSINRYTIGRCRCDKCRKAIKVYNARRRAAMIHTPPEEIPHGLNGYINYSCRCDVCKEANRKASAAARARRVG